MGSDTFRCSAGRVDSEALRSSYAILLQCIISTCEAALAFSCWSQPMIPGTMPLSEVSTFPSRLARGS